MSVITKPYIPLILITFASVSTFAADETYSIGVRGNVMSEDGVPANDMLGLGVYGKYHFEDGWAIGAGMDVYSYDFENVSEFIGLQGTNITDASTTTTQVNVWGEKSYQWTQSTKWYWGAGLGMAIVSIDPASGDLSGGGTYEITTETSSEIVILASLGMLWRFDKNWQTDVSAAIEHHSSEWKATDKVSGATKTLDSYTPMGVRLGLSYRY